MDFVSYVASSDIPDKYKLITILQLTTGSRISEILNLTKKNVEFKGNKARVLIRVLKKHKNKKGIKKKRYRYGAVAPQIVRMLRKHIFNLGQDDKLFTIHRKTAWQNYKKYFGIMPHALRHSWVIYLFEIKKFQIPQVVNELRFNNWSMALRYFNTQIDKNAWDMFADVA